MTDGNNRWRTAPQNWHVTTWRSGVQVRTGGLNWANQKDRDGPGPGFVLVK